jgi:tRNA (mo5U34)-methyltransferase
MTKEQIERSIKDLGPWFHEIAHEDLRTKTVLDVGGGGALPAIELKRRGARRVVGIDSDSRSLEKVRLAAGACGADVELYRMSVYDVAELRARFDIVFFLGVLFRLRYPLLALDLLGAHAVQGRLVCQSMLRGSGAAGELDDDYPNEERAIFDRPEYPKLHFVEGRYAGDPGSWWIPNRACAEAMLRSAGFEITAQPEVEVFVCRRAGG